MKELMLKIKAEWFKLVDDEVYINSRAIAVIVNKRHTTIMERIREKQKRLTRAKIGQTEIQFTEMDVWLNEQQYYIVISGMQETLEVEAALDQMVVRIQSLKEENKALKVTQQLEEQKTIHSILMKNQLFIEENMTKISYVNALLASEESLSLRSWSKLLQGDCGIEFGEKILVEWLLEQGCIYRMASGTLVPYAKSRRHFEMVLISTDRGNWQQLQITSQGQAKYGQDIIKEFS